MRQIERGSYSCIGICIRQGVKSTSNMTLRFTWLLFITLVLAEIDSYTLRNASNLISVRAYNGLPSSLFMNDLSLSRSAPHWNCFSTLSKPAPRPFEYISYFYDLVRKPMPPKSPGRGLSHSTNTSAPSTSCMVRMCSSTLPSTSALDGGVGDQWHAPSCFSPGWNLGTCDVHDEYLCVNCHLLWNCHAAGVVEIFCQ